MCAILQEENFGRRKKTPGTKKSRNADKYERVNWDSRLPDPTAPGEEFDSSKLGRDRRRRYLNEKILRDMAGAMTAADMEALFKPVPFGATGHESPLSKVTIPSDFPVWDLFRNIDEERQNATLQKWQTAARLNKRSRQEEGGKDSMAFTALKQWASVPKKAREAMKRCPEIVESLELPIIEFLGKDTLQDEGGPPVLELDLEDAYQRLLTHGIATYYKLQSRTDATGRTLLESTGRGSQSNASTQQITCADICFAISQDNPGGLTAQALYGYWKRLHYGTDADSEASYVIL